MSKCDEYAPVVTAVGDVPRFLSLKKPTQRVCKNEIDFDIYIVSNADHALLPGGPWY
jgi:hypothetical protein